MNAWDELRDRITELTAALAKAEAERDEARRDAERWHYLLTCWTCYAIVRLEQEEDGSWGIHLEEGIECADLVFFGDDPIKAINAAITSTNGAGGGT